MNDDNRLTTLKMQLYDGIITEEECRRKVKELPAPGRRALKVASILLIFNSSRWSFNVILVPLLLGVGDLNAIPHTPIIFAVCQLFAGIIGMIYSNNVEKVKALCIVGLLLLIVTMVFIVTTLLPSRFVFHLFYSVANLTLPIVFLYGAYKNQQAKKEELE